MEWMQFNDVTKGAWRGDECRARRVDRRRVADVLPRAGSSTPGSNCRARLRSSDSVEASTPADDPKPAGSSRAADPGPRRRRRTSPERRRLAPALLLSLLIHASLLSLTFGGQGFWL